MTRVNDGTVPNWKILVSSRYSEEDQDAAWNKYVETSKRLANLKTTPPAEKNGNVTYTSQLIADVAKNEEILRHYGYEWIPIL